MTGIGDYDWWEDDELEQEENRGQSFEKKIKQLIERGRILPDQFIEENNEDGNAHP